MRRIQRHGPTRLHLPILALPQHDVLLDLHDLDMIQVFRSTNNRPPLRIDLALLNNPRLGTADEPSRKPFRYRTRFLDQAGGFQGALVGERAGYDVAS